MYKSRTLGLNTFITLVLPMTAILLFNQVWLMDRKMERMMTNSILHGSGSHERTRRRRILRREPREKPHRTKWKVYQNAVYWINLKSPQDRELVGKHIPVAIILDNYVPACLEKVEQTRTVEILFQKIPLSLRLPHKFLLKSGWQIQNEGQVQHEGTKEKPVPDEMTIAPKIEFRIQGTIRAQDVDQAEERVGSSTWGRLVSAIRNHENIDALMPKCKANIRIRRSVRNQNDLFMLSEMSKVVELCQISSTFNVFIVWNIGWRRNCFL